MGVMGNCRSCGAELVWAKKADGKPTPLEACAPSDGNIHINQAGFAVVGRKGSGPYISHFAKCPQRDQWKGGGRPNGGQAA
jgi:hypothetical protein